jgi:hypothetical protein
MTYQEIQKIHPETWLLLEAIKAHSQGEFRILEDIAVLNTYPTSTAALEAYRSLHLSTPARELYVVHSSSPQLVIKERVWHGIRSAA